MDRPARNHRVVLHSICSHVKVLTEEEKNVQISKTLSFLLRHAKGKEPNLNVYKGGCYSLEELLALPQLKKFSSDDLVKCIETSISTRNPSQKRFELLRRNGKQYARATYGHSNSDDKIEELEFPEEEIEEISIPSLQQQCLNFIVANIKRYESFEGIHDPFILDSILNELKKRKMITNANIKLFLTPDLQFFDLNRDSFISDGTLKRVAKFCPALSHLGLEDCVSLTDTILGQISKGCKQLKSLHLIDCKYVTDQGLKELTKRCKDLKSVKLEGLSVTNDGISHLVTQCPHLTTLHLLRCPLLSPLSKDVSHIPDFSFVPSAGPSET